MRWKRVCAAVALTFTFALITTIASAHEIFQGDQCVIDSETVIEGDVFALCRVLRVDGTIEGSLFGSAFTAEINGSVRDDIYLLAGQLDVRGTIGEDVIFGGPVLQVHPTAQFEDEWGHLISLSISSQLMDGARIPASITSISYQLLLDGEIGRDINFWGSALRVGGTVQGDIEATVGDSQSGDASQLQTLLVPFRFEIELIDPGLIVTENGRVEGLLHYTAPTEGIIDGQLSTDAAFTPIVTVPDFTQINFAEEEDAAWLGSYFGGVVREFISLLFIGLLGLLLVPRAVQTPLQNLRWRPINSLGVGLIAFFMSFVIWIVVLLLIVLLIVIFLLLSLGDLVIVSLMGFGLLNIGVSGLFFFVAFYVSRILVALAVGRLLVRLLIGDDGSQRVLYVSLIVGTALLALLVWLPVLGWFVNAVALILGLGSVVLTISAAQFRMRSMQQTVQVAGSVTLSPDDSRPIPPPILDESRNNPGMENLPKGFRWWSEDD